MLPTWDFVVIVLPFVRTSSILILILLERETGCPAILNLKIHPGSQLLPGWHSKIDKAKLKRINQSQWIIMRFYFNVSTNEPSLYLKEEITFPLSEYIVQILSFLLL